MAEHDIYPTPSFEGNNYMPENPESAMFPMAGQSFSHPVSFEQMSMDLDSLNIPFEWVS